MRINQNIMAFNAQRNLGQTQNAMAATLEKLSSGFRINRAADDAAGLAKSESLRSEIRGTDQAVRNAQDGVSWVQTAEGALEEVHSVLQRMRELAVDAANTATTDGEEQQAELQELRAELAAIGERTTFAGDQVFGDFGATDAELTFFVTPLVEGAAAGQVIQIDRDLSIALSDPGGEDSVGGVFAGIEVAITETSDWVALDDVDLQVNAEAAIGFLDEAISNVSQVRSELGATQNRLEHTIANLEVASENLSASESRIRDADMAAEIVEFTRHQILQQSGTAMLAQANFIPQTVLGLLQ